MQEKHKVLIVGSGGREHAFTWKISLSDKVETIFVAPGNAGTSQEHKTTNIDISPNDIPALIQFSKDEQINLVIVGPEDPLVNLFFLMLARPSPAHSHLPSHQELHRPKQRLEEGQTLCWLSIELFYLFFSLDVLLLEHGAQTFPCHCQSVHPDDGSGGKGIAHVCSNLCSLYSSSTDLGGG